MADGRYFEKDKNHDNSATWQVWTSISGHIFFQQTKNFAPSIPTRPAIFYENLDPTQDSVAGYATRRITPIYFWASNLENVSIYLIKSLSRPSEMPIRRRNT